MSIILNGGSMSASERAKERGCELPITLVAKIHGKTRDSLNKTYANDPMLFDKMVDIAVEKWNFICKKWDVIKTKKRIK